MKISYAITVCNEFVEIQKLIPFLLKNKRHEDEIVVLYDSKNGDSNVEEFLRAKSINAEFSWHKDEFDGHFANWKNKLTDFCGGILSNDNPCSFPSVVCGHFGCKTKTKYNLGVVPPFLYLILTTIPLSI